MTPEIEGYLLTIKFKEKQALADIRLGLLATLNGYVGPKRVKEAFEKALRDVTLD